MATISVGSSAVGPGITEAAIASGLTANTYGKANGSSTAIVDSIMSDDGSIATIAGGLTVTGDLVVSGDTVQQDVSTLTVEDPLIELARSNAADAFDTGFYATYNDGTEKYAGLFRDATDGVWKLFEELEDEPTTTVDTGGTGFAFASFQAGTATLAGLTVSGNDLNLGAHHLRSVDASQLAIESNNAATNQLRFLNSSGTLLARLQVQSSVFRFQDAAGTTDLLDLDASTADFASGVAIAQAGTIRISSAGAATFTSATIATNTTITSTATTITGGLELSSGQDAHKSGSIGYVYTTSNSHPLGGSGSVVIQPRTDAGSRFVVIMDEQQRVGLKVDDTAVTIGDGSSNIPLVIAAGGSLKQDSTTRLDSSGNASVVGLAASSYHRRTGVISPTALAADVNDWSPTGLSTCSRIRASASGGNRNITGIAAQPDGTVITISNVGTSNSLVLVNESASSSAANRFVAAAGGNVTIRFGGSVNAIYDGTTARWRVRGV